MTQKSKIVKLKNKSERLKFWHKWGGMLLSGNALISIITTPICLLSKCPAILMLLQSFYFCSSIFVGMGHMLIGEKKIVQKIREIDQQTFQLVKKDKIEMAILREQDKIADIKRDLKNKEKELKKQRELVKTLIKDKNLQAKGQKKYLKVLISRYKNQARAMAEQDLEEMLEYEDILNNTTLD